MNNKTQLHIVCKDCGNHYICKYQEVIALVSSIAKTMDFNCKYFVGKVKPETPAVSQDQDDIHSRTHRGICHICGEETDVVACDVCGQDTCLKHGELEDSLDILSDETMPTVSSTQFICNDCG